ncbi:MAG: [FeFe] hydrogenase, group A [Lachnospiraceae bacterium]|nr:[FeFe] hydrogenase, group A [Lachnospiraceae bacterium]
MLEVQIKINGIPVIVPEGTSILKVARMANIKIPTLCWLKEINEIASCRMCVVEVKGEEELVTSCVTEVREGMEILTHSSQVVESRKSTLRLIMANHEQKCLTCVRNNSCELQKLCHEHGIDDASGCQGREKRYEVDDSAVHMVRDNNKCIMCRRCVAVCREVEGVGVIGVHGKGNDSYIGSPFDMGLGETTCVSCGQCINVCPTGALYEKQEYNAVFSYISDPSKYVVVQTAPAVRAGLGEYFGLPVGTGVEGKMVTALKMLGFDKIFDTNTGADFTIVEEAKELVKRLEEGEKLPLFTSCCPAWIKYCEHYNPEIIDHLSTCKSPHEMLGALIKTYYAENIGIPAKDIVVVSVMPCTAKKFEIKREDENAAGFPDVDIVITTRELGRMIGSAGICFGDLPEGEFDTLFNKSSGAGKIFGASGGVMEAALRTAYEMITQKEAPSLEFQEIRGTKGIKTAEYRVGDQQLKVAVVSGLKNAANILESIKNREAEYHFVEIMACPGGCVNGGGQTRQASDMINFGQIAERRAKILYDMDSKDTLRKSHENPVVTKLYEEFLDEQKAHEYLHTSYVSRGL